MAVADLDTRAKKILFDMHWGPKGWRDTWTLSVDDRAHALKHRMLFPRENLPHDALVRHLVAAYKALSLRDVVGAFLASLSTRRLDLRSGLGSYVLASHLKMHPFQSGPNEVWCEVCGGTRENKELDLDVLNFERHKWSGVRHSWPTYQYLDLRELVRALPATPEPADHKIWADILRAIASTPKADGPGALEKRLKDVLPSSQQERKQLLEILAIAGVLVPAQDRSSPGEWMHVGMWRGADRYDAAQVERLFGPLQAAKAAKKPVKPAKKPVKPAKSVTPAKKSVTPAKKPTKATAKTR